MMPEEEARKLQLVGSDTFLRTQLAYRDELNKESLIMYLNREAYLAFTDTILIGQYPLLKQERELMKSDWTISTPTIFRQLEYWNLDNLKIAAGFELHLKACLLSKDIVIHLINGRTPFNTAQFNALRNRQDNEPVYKSELFAIEGYYFNGTLNILRGLTSLSLKLDKILNSSKY